MDREGKKRGRGMRMRRFALSGSGLPVLTALVIATLAVAAPSAGAATFTVDQTTNTADPAINGVCDTNGATAGSPCTLRGAIQEANATVAADTIGFSAAFDGPGGGTTDTIALGAGVTLPRSPSP